ncbi:MAG TPA: DNA repair protein RadC [Candidatus Paceibacterota bacterium]
MKIKDFQKVDRPREKMAKYGPNKLNDSELLALLLRTGIKGKNAIEVARSVLRKFGIAGLAATGYAELKKIKGIGPIKAGEILAAVELGRRVLKDKKTKLYLSPEQVWHELKEYRDHKKEHLIALYLDSRSQEIKREVISIGTLNANLVHPREVFEAAIKNSAAQLILAHNHPSGDPEPSVADIDITKDLISAAKILGIELIDHYTISRNGWRSIRERIAELG